MPRIKQADLDHHLSIINRGLKDGLRIECQGRNGYFGLDLYDGSGCVKTLTTGTKRDCLVWLRGCYEALYLTNRV